MFFTYTHKSSGRTFDFEGKGNPPPGYREGARNVLRALIAAEQRTGYQFYPYVSVRNADCSMGVGHSEDAHENRPWLGIGRQYLQPGYASIESMQDSMMHELGHHHYRHLASYRENIMPILQRLDEACNFCHGLKSNPEDGAKRVIFAFGSVEAFNTRLQAALRQITEAYTKNLDPSLIEMNDTQMSDRLLREHLARRAGKPAVNSPAESLKNMHREDSTELLHMITHFLDRSHPVSVKELPDQTELLKLRIDALIGAIDDAGFVLGRVSRATEYLCDDYAVMHSADPRSCAKRLGEYNHHEDITDGGYSHPTHASRMARSASLARHMQTATQMGGSLATTEFSYSRWLERRTAKSTMPNITSEPRTLS